MAGYRKSFHALTAHIVPVLLLGLWAGHAAAQVVADDVVCSSCVNTGDIADKSIKKRDLSAGAVGTAKIVNGAVTEGKIADNAVSLQKLSLTVQQVISTLEARVTALESSAGGGGFPFVLKDAEGDLIGPATVHRNDGFVNITTLVEFTTLDGLKQVALHARNGFDDTRAFTSDAQFRETSLPFLSTDCTGAPHVWGDQGFPGAIWSASVVEAPGGAGILDLYIATSQVSAVATVQSTLRNGICSPSSFDYFVFPAELVVSDLYFGFPRPFTLETPAAAIAQ